MGRRKIQIKTIQNASSRRATFEKRRIGLLKKAMELSILCDARISLTIERKVEGDLQIYASEPFDEIIDRYQRFEGTYRLLTNDHIDAMVPGKNSSNNVGYHVQKQDIGNGMNNDQYKAFTQAQYSQQMPPMTQMEIIPTVPSPSLNHLMSRLSESSVGVPQFSAFQFPQIGDQQQQFQFIEMNSLSIPPRINAMNPEIKRSHELMNGNNGDIVMSQPPRKRLKTQNNSNDTSETATIEM